MPRSLSEHGLAGQDWWLKFAERHQLTLRAPESKSIARASAFNKPVVNMFFSNLAKVMDEHKFSLNQIYNCDETGLTTVPKPKAVVAKRGTKQDRDFAPSATTDNIFTVSGAADDGREEQPGLSDRHDEPGPSVRHEQGPSDRHDEPEPSPRPYVSPADIRPFSNQQKQLSGPEKNSQQRSSQAPQQERHFFRKVK
ncbi:forkhead-associated domain-containing protein 1 [Elysia marginata]|uniref:Forkhead-associated domain-containing protein 1 n=1 Tax=Elysia marginata TaxID=1093978 RepID=A0AAV4GVU0_9GAST|nr:forkhead-associated domain-containing protein 1 [Elysia marginata]